MRLDAHIELMANVLVRDRVEKLERRIEQLELGHAAALGELANLRAAQSVDPTGVHPYRSGPRTSTVAAGSPVAASSAPERVEGRPGAWRRVCGALARRWPYVGAAAGFSLASAQMFDLSPTLSGMLAGLAGIVMVHVGVWEYVR